MKIDHLFHSSADRISAFLQAQLHLYRHDPSLQDYFMMLQLDSLKGPRGKSSSRSVSDRFVKSGVWTSERVNRFRGVQKLKADILFCPMPDSSRKTESRFLIRSLLGLVQTDATILCLLPSGVPFRDKLEAELTAVGRRGQVTFVDPFAHVKRLDARLRWMATKVRAREAFEKTVEILEPFGLHPGLEVQENFRYIANSVEAWEKLEHTIDFDYAVARCHWHALCSPVCRTAQQRDKPVITFQQGVISHTLDVPVTASTYVAFGQSSASFLDAMNREFFRAAEVEESPVNYVSGGSLYDTVSVLPDQFDNQTLLIVDVPQPEGQGDFYGVEDQCAALLQLADRLLCAEVPLRRLVIRPHPFWSNLNLENCQRIVQRHSSRCELSHPSWPLDYDLGRSSVVAGIFSGVLTVSSACGLPTIFLQTENGFRTGDLACFSPRQTLLPDAAFSEIRHILTDKRAYSEARKLALDNARGYYANGTNLDVNGALFERLLRPRAEAKPSQTVLAK